MISKSLKSNFSDFLLLCIFGVKSKKVLPDHQFYQDFFCAPSPPEFHRLAHYTGDSYASVPLVHKLQMTFAFFFFLVLMKPRA